MICFNFKLVLTACLLFSLLITSCSPAEVKLPAPRINLVSKNTTFIVKLDENHEANENWILNTDSLSQAVFYLNSVWHGSEKGVYFHFKAGEAGLSKLIFTKRRISDTLDVKTYIVKISDN